MHPEMGADRIADVVAAWKLHGNGKRKLIVMGLGTASTMLAVDLDRKIVGGVIAPGVNLMFEILHQRTALLPKFTINGAKPKMSMTTAGQIKNGILLTATGMVKDWAAAAQKELGGDALIVGTGGLAQVLANKDSGLFDVVDSELTLKGAYLIGRAKLFPRTRARQRKV
jgi:type III pantothenate kinase